MWFYIYTDIVLVYKDDEDKAYVLPVVRIAEKILANDNTLSGDYSPVLGLESFRNAATKILLGADNPAIVENRVRINLHFKVN